MNEGMKNKKANKQENLKYELVECIWTSFLD